MIVQYVRSTTCVRARLDTVGVKEGESRLIALEFTYQDTGLLGEFINMFFRYSKYSIRNCGGCVRRWATQ